MENKFVLQNGVLVVSCDGEIDLKSAPTYREEIDAELERTEAQYLVFDMEKVTFIDSSGLGMIMGRYKKVCRSGGRVALCRIQEDMERMLEVAGLRTLMTIYPTRQEAIEGV